MRSLISNTTFFYIRTGGKGWGGGDGVAFKFADIRNTLNVIKLGMEGGGWIFNKEPGTQTSLVTNKGKTYFLN